MVCKWSCYGKIKTCKIHDLMRDVCWLNAWKEKFLYFANSSWDCCGAEFWQRVRTLLDFGNAADRTNSYVMARSLIYGREIFDDLSWIYLDFGLL